MMLSISLLIFSILPLCFSEVWYVDVYTGNERFAGTDSNVYITLFNEDGDSTREFQLTHYNWQPENGDFPIRNLFEIGARERFRIETELMGSVVKIQVRHNNFPAVQADWLLKKVVLERNRDGRKFTFPCDCWLRGRKPYVIIPVLPDQSTLDKNKNKDTSSKNNRAFISVMIILITLIVSIFCCFNQYRRRQRHRSLSFTDTIEQIQQEPSLLETDQSSSSEGPQLWIKTKRRWKNFRTGLPSYTHARTTQNATTSITTPSDQPPSYEDLYPTATPSNNTASNL